MSRHQAMILRAVCSSPESVCPPITDVMGLTFRGFQYSSKRNSSMITHPGNSCQRLHHDPALAKGGNLKGRLSGESLHDDKPGLSNIISHRIKHLVLALN